MPASPAQRAATAARREKAIALALAGVDYPTIATQLGYSHRAAVSTDIRRALADNRKRMDLRVDEYRTVETMRYDRLQAAIWSRCLAGELEAIDRFLAISRERKRTWGIDATIQVDMTYINELAVILDGLMPADVEEDEPLGE
jgi:hypothetical protein